jgi:hypothetical protein
MYFPLDHFVASDKEESTNRFTFSILSVCQALVDVSLIRALNSTG